MRTVLILILSRTIITTVLAQSVQTTTSFEDKPFKTTEWLVGYTNLPIDKVEGRSRYTILCGLSSHSREPLPPDTLRGCPAARGFSRGAGRSGLLAGPARRDRQ